MHQSPHITECRLNAGASLPACHLESGTFCVERVRSHLLWVSDSRRSLQLVCSTTFILDGRSLDTIQHRTPLLSYIRESGVYCEFVHLVPEA
jgi:hypothetical protein